MSALSALPPTTTEQLRLPLERPVAGEAFVTSDSNAEAVRVLARQVLDAMDADPD